MKTAAAGGPTIYHPGDPAPFQPASAPPIRTLSLQPAPSAAASGEPSLLQKVQQRRGAILTTLVSIAAIGSFAGVIWWAHQQDVKAGGQGVIPMIRPDERPIKVKPDNPGGLKVPHQDNTAYQRINPDGGPPVVERLSPPPPVPRIPTGPPTPPLVAAAPPQSPSGGTPTPLAAPPAPPVAQPAPASTPAAAAAPAEAKGGPSIASLIEGLSGGAQGWRVQLSSVKTEEAARATWAKLQKANSDVLGALQMQALRVDLGDKGTWYRVQAGPLDQQSAQSACSSLKGRSVDCVVVPPSR